MDSLCRHHVGLLWLPLHDDHRFFTFVTERSLGFAINTASTVAQRLVAGIVYVLLRVFDAVDAPFLESETCPRRLKWIRARGALPDRIGRTERRLVSAMMYTDDPTFLAVGADRAIRLLRVWRWLTRHMNLTMAIAAKHAIGTRATWLGLIHLPELGSQWCRSASSLAH